MRFARHASLFADRVIMTLSALLILLVYVALFLTETHEKHQLSFVVNDNVELFAFLIYMIFQVAIMLIALVVLTIRDENK